MADEDLELDVEGEEAPKSKKKMFIIIGSVLLLLVIGGGAGMLVMNMFGSDPEESAIEEVADGETDENDKEAEPEELSDEALYWPLEPPFVMNFEGKSKAKYMQISVVAMSRSPKSIATVKKHMPAIRSELQFLLGSQKYVEMITPEGKEQVREEIMETMNNIIKSNDGGQGLDKIYFTSFVMQ